MAVSPPRTHLLGRSLLYSSISCRIFLWRDHRCMPICLTSAPRRPQAVQTETRHQCLTRRTSSAQWQPSRHGSHGMQVWCCNRARIRTSRRTPAARIKTARCFCGAGSSRMRNHHQPLARWLLRRWQLRATQPKCQGRCKVGVESFSMHGFGMT